MAFEKYKQRFLQEKYRFNTGYAEFSWVKGMGGFFMLVYLTIKDWDLKIPLWLMAAAVILILMGFWVIGYLWDKAHMNHIGAEVSNERNYFMKEVRKALRINKRKP